MLTALHDGMLKAPREGRSEFVRRGAGGMGGRPGVEMCAVFEGRRVGRLCVRGPVVWVGPSAAASSEVDDGAEVLLFAGGEYGGIDSPVETVV